MYTVKTYVIFVKKCGVILQHKLKNSCTKNLTYKITSHRLVLILSSNVVSMKQHHIVIHFFIYSVQLKKNHYLKRNILLIEMYSYQIV